MKRKGLAILILFLMQISYTGCATIKANYLYPYMTIVSDDDLSHEQILSTEPLFGYRKFPAELFKIIDTEGKQIGIPAQVFIESAKATPWVKSAITKLGKNPSTATLSDWYMASKSTADFGKTSTKKTMESLNCTQIGNDDVCVDPILMASLPETEIFKSDKPVTFVRPVGGQAVDWIEVDTKNFEAFKCSYDLLSSAGHLPSSQAQKRFKYASASMASLPFLANATEFNAGQVTFGKPVVYTAAEKKLVLPESVVSTNDVYWIEFAVSFRDIEIRNIEQLTFGVTATTGVIALELIPLRFDKEISTTRIFSSPEIKIRVGDKAVEIGKVFEQTVVYKSLKYTIVAEGLQESEFLWTLTEDAVQPGAIRFIGIIQAPKGKEILTLQFQASAKTRPRYLGIVQGDIISTKPKLVEIRVK